MKTSWVNMNFLFWLFSITPIFSVTTDIGFGGKVTKDSKIEEIRFAVIKLPIGGNKFYLITYFNKEFKLAYRLSLKNLKYGAQVIEKIKSKLEVEKERLKEIKEDEYEEKYLKKFGEEKEFILYLISNEKERRSTAHTKLDIYTATYLVVIPIIISIIPINFQELNFDNISKLELVCYIFLIYYIISIGLFLFETIKVGGIYRRTFSEFKENKEVYRENLAYYYDWQHESRYSDLLVSFILNIQSNIFYLFLTTLLTVVIGKLV